MSKKDKAKAKKTQAKKTKAKKTRKAKAVPAGFHTATPYLFVQGAANAIEFYKSAFKAKEIMRMPASGGRVGHAQIKIGDSHIMISDESPDMGAVGPKGLGGSPVMLYLYVKDVDAVVAQAVAAGAKLVHPVKDQFYGDRSGALEDPFGHLWHVATHKEDVPLKELRKRAETAMGSQGQK
jgi:PhnB protein